MADGMSNAVDYDQEQLALEAGPERLVITLTPLAFDRGHVSVHVAWEGVFDDEPRRVVGCHRFSLDTLLATLDAYVSEWHRIQGLVTPPNPLTR